MGLANEILDCASANLVGTVANIECEPRFGGDHVRCSGSCLDLSNSRHQPRNCLSISFYRDNPFRRARDGVAAKMHGRRARMVGAATKCELQPALAGNSFDHRQWLVQSLPNRP